VIEVDIEDDENRPSLEYIVPWLDEVKDKVIEMGRIEKFKLTGIPSEMDLK
jgi:hypothetical protein